MSFHHTTQNSAQLKIYELFIYGTFHLIFLGHGYLWVSETVECETMDKQDYCVWNRVFTGSLSFSQLFFTTNLKGRYFYPYSIDKNTELGERIHLISHK